MDSTFNVTLIVTSIVFIITQILTFWYSYKYQEEEGRVGLFLPHDNKLEIIWTVIPAVVMTFLVVSGLETWNTVMADVAETEIPGEDYIEIEATGHQFAWTLRYPGEDNLIGEKNYKLISSLNPLGQNWEDKKNLDDTHPSEMVIPVGKKIRVRITSKDVLHNFYLPHFRVKMDAVPGLPTYFVFTPKVTTEKYRENLGQLDDDGNPMYPEWHEPSDPEDPTSAKRFETFEYELACAELCGKGHFSMKRIVKVVTQEEYDAWLGEQQSFFESNVKGTADDPAVIQQMKEAMSSVESHTEEAHGEEADHGDHGDAHTDDAHHDEEEHHTEGH